MITIRDIDLSAHMLYYFFMINKKSTVIIRLEPELKEKLRVLSKDRGRPMAGFMAQLLRDFVQDHPEQLEKAIAKDKE